MKIVIEDYQEGWSLRFGELETKIRQALASFDVTIEHIGSTSVTGLGAKPIIDILLGVQNETTLNQVIQPMQQAGFTYIKKLEPGWPERRLFVLLSPLSGRTIPSLVDVTHDDSYQKHFVATAHIHTVVKDTYDWQRHIAFRDYIRAHAPVREKYYHLKKRLSEQEFENMLAYNAAKNEFVKATEKEALAWWNKKVL